MYPENPLPFGKRLEDLGIDLLTPILFHGWHVLPPLVIDKKLEALSQENDFDMKDDWKGLFMAAHFIAIGTRR